MQADAVREDGLPQRPEDVLETIKKWREDLMARPQKVINFPDKPVSCWTILMLVARFIVLLINRCPAGRFSCWYHTSLFTTGDSQRPGVEVGRKAR